MVESRAEAGDGSRECMLRWCALADDQGGEVLLVGAVVRLESFDALVSRATRGYSPVWRDRP